MMRALWSAASGMLAQQSNIDIISNNLSNVNTLGYKRVRAEFHDLFYANMRVPGALGVTEDQMQLPLQVGSGVRLTATRRDFNMGIMEDTGKPFDLMLTGPGFFCVQTPQGVRYTRAGAFTYSPTGRGDEMGLYTPEGYPLLLAEGNLPGAPVLFPGDTDTEQVLIRYDGSITTMHGGDPANDRLLGNIAVVLFSNPSGLLDIGRNLYDESASSGERTMLDPTNPVIPGQQPTEVMQGFIEGSNVAPVDEFVKMIVAQRAYEMNSKAIQASDEMLQQANNLRR
ncbi:MAG: flagellar hook-basal body complex protein [Symbiobacteriaceae bacterium]|nr:flagellar hook-basal body complex protein [Symbiobacteriaceae bacterium]